ncbi:BioF 7-keto-8-aminopelargonate synthetase and related enzymes [Candidatus Methylopumilus universalis]|uniref:aminotransferase class I/II-fold pyridoxal phosphate-dependent enzyme n=1 Tax=Candidatus Methylopumilus universalis TaxID=2588536 RepID=UPI003BEEF5D4
MLDQIHRELQSLKDNHLFRTRKLLSGRLGSNLSFNHQNYLSFCSNDYLGLSQNQFIQDALIEGIHLSGNGMGASHLISGHHEFHEAFENAFSEALYFERALLFSSGYMANMGVISALAGKDDAIFSDKLNHASLNDAAILSRASHKRYRHNDMSHLEELIRESKSKVKIIVTDAVFSMDGDIADIPHLIQLAEAYDTYLYIDDAHGFGVLGKEGKGVLQHFADLEKINILYSSRLIYMATLGKSAGIHGAVVASSNSLIEYLVQKSKQYIYTTAIPAFLAFGLKESLNQILNAHEARAHVKDLVASFRMHIKLKKLSLGNSLTPIQPVIVGNEINALRLNKWLIDKGIYVPAIRPPSVPKGTSRMRISFSALHSHEDVKKLIKNIIDFESNLDAH